MPMLINREMVNEDDDGCCIELWTKNKLLV